LAFANSVSVNPASSARLSSSRIAVSTRALFYGAKIASTPKLADGSSELALKNA
jgi:hypothetical protein